ncbi:MAG: VWA domain-containing protein [Planctomycetota bacterium]
MIQLEHPLWLLALVPIVPWLWVGHRRSYADLEPSRARLALASRALGLMLVVLALTRPVLTLTSEEQALVFVVDVSESVPDEALEARWQSIEEQTRRLQPDQRAGLILFAQRPRLAVAPRAAPLDLQGEPGRLLRRQLFHRRERERLRARRQELERGALDPTAQRELQGLAGEEAELERWRAELGVEATDIAAACRLARGTLPRGVRRRVVLVSDGNQNRGELLGELEALREDGVVLDAWPLRAGAATPELIAEELRAPAEARVKAPFDLELALRASQKTKARVTVYRNKFQLSSQELELQPGRNVLTVPRVQLEEGFHEFEAVVAPVDAKADTRPENNVARAAVRVEGRPRVLVIERELREARYFADALQAEEIEVELRPPQGLPTQLNELLGYHVLVLSDVPADVMTRPQMDLIKRYVKELGGGLVMLGGEKSFGLGGYYRTPVEEALPVRMPVRKNIEKPNLALVLVIDRSGSMSGDKIQLAKEAAIASSEVLKSTDEFGVVAFDSVAQWICPLTSATERDRIVATVARLEAGGGTNIYPGLYRAYQALLDSRAKLKHIILLSDGHTQGSGYEELVSHIAADEITVSTVGIGQDADQNLLSSIAQWGGGESYFTTDFSAIPQIFTRETLRASKSMLVEEPFLPKLVNQHAALKGIDWATAPELLGYVATQPKREATLVLASEYGDPVLAVWNYGLGRAAAWTSDAKARWAGDWIGWEGFGKLWAQLVRSVMSTGAQGSVRTTSQVRIEDGQVKLTLDVRGRRGEFRDDVQPELLLSTEAARAPRPVQVRHTAPGVFEAEFPLESYGAFHRLLVAQRAGGELVDTKVLAVTESYSPEYRRTGPDEDLLRLAAERAGGRYDPAPQETWRSEGPGAPAPRDVWWWALLAATVLLPLDVAIRRTA